MSEFWNAIIFMTVLFVIFLIINDLYWNEKVKIQDRKYDVGPKDRYDQYMKAWNEARLKHEVTEDE